MTGPTLEKQDTDDRHGRYVARVDGIDGVGELTFTRRGPDIVSADHTGVPEAMAGEGVASALLDALLADARESGFRIVPACSFVRERYARHPEWADLFTVAPGEDPPG